MAMFTPESVGVWVTWGPVGFLDGFQDQGLASGVLFFQKCEPRPGAVSTSCRCNPARVETSSWIGPLHTTLALGGNRVTHLWKSAFQRAIFAVFSNCPRNPWPSSSVACFYGKVLRFHAAMCTCIARSSFPWTSSWRAARCCFWAVPMKSTERFRFNRINGFTTVGASSKAPSSRSRELDRIDRAWRRSREEVRGRPSRLAEPAKGEESVLI